MATPTPDDEAAPSPPPPPPDLNAIVAGLLAPSNQPVPKAQPVDTDDNAPTSWAGLLGEHLSGGAPADVDMTKTQREAAGRRALLNFSAGLMSAGPFDSLGQGVAAGLRGAQESQYSSEGLQAERQLAAQDWQQQQLQNRITALKEAVPLLRLQVGAGLPNPLAPGSSAATAPGSAPGTAIAGNSYEGAITGHEGTGANPRSSAAGIGQFLTSTWQDFAAANPDLFKGMTPAQVLAARNDPVIANQAINWLAQQNANTLTKAGVAPSGQSLGIAHYLGAGGAAKVMGAPDSDPVSKYVSDAAVKANPELATMTVGQMKARYAAVPDPGFMGSKPGTATAAVPSATKAPPGPADIPPADIPRAGAPVAPVAAPTPPPVPAQGDQPPPIADASGGLVAGVGAPSRLAPARPMPGTAGDVGAIISGMQGAATNLAAPRPAVAPATTVATTGPPPITPPPITPTAQPAPPQMPPPDKADGELTWEEYQLRHPVAPLSPDQITQGTIKIDPKAEANRAEAVAGARAEEASAAQNLSNIQRGLVTGDVNKATQAHADAVAKLTQANQNYSDLYRQSQVDTATSLRALQQPQIDAQQKNYAQAQALAATARENALNRKNEIDKINASSDAQASTKALEDVNEAGRGATQTLQQIEMARQLSAVAGTPNFLEMHPDLFNNLIRVGMVSPDDIKQFGAQQALNGVINKMVLAARQGSGMSRMTNMDLQFLQNTAPGSFTPEEVRGPMLAALQTTYQRQAQYAHIVNALHGSGMPVWQAEQKADETLGSIIPQAPKMDDPTSRDYIADPAARFAAQGKWISNPQNVPMGSFYLTPNGDLNIRGLAKKPPQQPRQ